MAMLEIQKTAMLAARITKKVLMLSVMAKAAAAQANPQYQSSALNPANQFALAPAGATRGVSDGQSRGTALRSCHTLRPESDEVRLLRAG
ncbi:MAG: hypothetical protein JWO13_255 [Acidobacteriales bacterium]|nr:hypothetical protein [Terriglobales bacterium]